MPCDASKMVPAWQHCTPFPRFTVVGWSGTLSLVELTTGDSTRAAHSKNRSTPGSSISPASSICTWQRCLSFPLIFDIRCSSPTAAALIRADSTMYLHKGISSTLSEQQQGAHRWDGPCCLLATFQDIATTGWPFRCARTAPGVEGEECRHRMHLFQTYQETGGSC